MAEYDDDDPQDEDGNGATDHAPPEADAERIALNRGFSSGLSKSFEMVLGPLVFGLIGYGIDRLLGTVPIFTIILAVFALVGGWTKVFLDYSRQMKSYEDEMPWNE